MEIGVGLSFIAILLSGASSFVCDIDEKIIKQNKKIKNLQIFAVNMEQPNTLKTKKFFSDLNIKKLEIFFDRKLNFVKEFKLRGVPTTILINKEGHEFARIIGEVNFQDKKFLKWLLKYD